MTFDVMAARGQIPVTVRSVLIMPALIATASVFVIIYIQVTHVNIMSDIATRSALVASGSQHWNVRNARETHSATH